MQKTDVSSMLNQPTISHNKITHAKKDLNTMSSRQADLIKGFEWT